MKMCGGKKEPGKHHLRSALRYLFNNVADLLKVKTLITLIVMAIWAILAIDEREIPESVNIVVAAVIAFYFGTQHENGRNAKRREDDEKKEDE